MGTAWAHGSQGAGELVSGFRLEVIAPLLLLAGLYALGWSRLARRRPLRARRPAFMLIGFTALVVALLSPVDRIAETLFVVHMVQHMLLIAVAAPALLLADPFPLVVWALPRASRPRAGRFLTRASVAGRLWRLATGMSVAWVAAACMLWGWHLPSAYDAALARRWLHDLEHLGFFLGAILFWWPVVHPAPRYRRPAPYPTRVAYLVLGAFQTSALGLLLTLWPAALYRSYAGAAALDDQVWGGVVMWGFGGAVDMIAVLVLLGAALGGDSKPAPPPRARSRPWVSTPGV